MKRSIPPRAAFVLIVLFVISGCSQPGEPEGSLPPDPKLTDPIPYDSLGSGTLVFQRDNLYFLNADTKSWLGMHFGGAQPVVSPNGTQLAYIACIECGGFGSGGYEVFLRNVGESVPENLSLLGVGSFSASPKWVGDSAIAYSTGPTVYIQSVSGLREKRAIYSFSAATMGGVEISASGIGTLAVTNNGALYVMDLDGTNVRFLTSTSGSDSLGRLQAPAISPDGASVAYLRSTWTPNLTELVLLSVDGNQSQVLHSVEAYLQFVHSNGSTLSSVCWSPDGSRIAFTMPVPEVGGLKGASGAHIYVVRPDGTGLTQITTPTPYQFDESLSWY